MERDSQSILRAMQVLPAPPPDARMKGTSDWIEYGEWHR